MSKKNSLVPKFLDWILIAIGIILLIIVFISNVSAQLSYPLRREEQPKWYFGEGLGIGDVFEYQICDSILKIPESPSPCYVVTLEFLKLLPTPQGKTWIVAVHVDHNANQVDTIFQILEDSFKIKTDGTTIQYAQSVERTLGWINNYASKFEPQPLAVGRSWGIVDSQFGYDETELLLTQLDFVNVGEKTHETYKVAYSLIKESTIQIKDEFPFPMQAVVYKPVSAYQNAPLAFTVDLYSYSRSNMCSVFEYRPIVETKDLSSNKIQNDTSKYDELLDDDSDDGFNVISTEEEIERIENYQYNGTVEQGLSFDDYQKLEQVFGNITSFLKFLTDAANKLIENQTQKK
jgi:hypothetical protein